MNQADHFDEFEKLWGASLARAESTPDWNDLTLQEQQERSSEFRREMDRYGEQDPLGERMEGGLYSSPRNSKRAG